MAYDAVNWSELTPDQMYDAADGRYFAGGGGTYIDKLPTDDEYYASLNGKSNWGNLGDQLKQIGATHGLTAADFNQGFNSYLTSTGFDPNNESIQTGRGIANWWGPQAAMRAYLQGVGQNKPELADLYKQYANPAMESAQQKGIAENYDRMQEQYGNYSDWDWLPGVLSILGLGMGVNGMYGAGGLGAGAESAAASGAASGAGDVFGMGYGGYGPPELAAGGVVGGGGLDAGVPAGEPATGAAPNPDALDGMQGFAGFNGGDAAAPTISGGETGGLPYGGEGTPAGSPTGAPADLSPPTPGPSGIDVGGGGGSGGGPGGGGAPELPGVPEAQAPTAPVNLGEPGPEFGMGYGGYGPEGQAAAPITDLSTKAGLGDNVRLAATNVPNGTTTAVDKALKFLGITDDKGNMGKNALSLAGLGLSQANASKNKASLSKDLTAAAGPASAAAQQLLSQGLSGQAPAAIIANADKTLNDRTQEVIQRYSNMGRDAKTDSAAQAEISKLKLARDASLQAYAQALTSQGLQAAGLAQGPTTQAAIAAAQSDKDFSNSVAQMLQQMAMMQAMQSRAGAPA